MTKVGELDLLGQTWANHARGCETCQNEIICTEYLKIVKTVNPGIPDEATDYGTNLLK